MPTRPARRERRRTDRLNATQSPVPTPSTQPPKDLPLASLQPFLPYLRAAPVVRATIRPILIQICLIQSQATGFEMWKEALMQDRPHSSGPENTVLKYQIARFGVLIEMHTAHVRDMTLLLQKYLYQLILWGLECSKERAEWDEQFIARRRLEIAQLNRRTHRVAAIFEDVLVDMLAHKSSFSTETERRYMAESLGKFRAGFLRGAKRADRLTLEALQRQEARVVLNGQVGE